MKHRFLLPILSIALVLGLVACAADGTEADDQSKIDQSSQGLLSSSSGGLTTSGGFSNWCQAKLDCENNCIHMYPNDPILQSTCKKIDSCATKCDSKLMFQ